MADDCILSTTLTRLENFPLGGRKNVAQRHRGRMLDVKAVPVPSRFADRELILRHCCGFRRGCYAHLGTVVHTVSCLASDPMSHTASLNQHTGRIAAKNTSMHAV